MAMRKLFGIPRHVNYLNTAFAAPLMRPVKEAGARRRKKIAGTTLRQAALILKHI